MTTVARFDLYGTVYAITFPYDAMVIVLIKSTVPSYARSWQPTTRQWFVDAGWAAPLAAALRLHGCVVVGIETPAEHSCADWARAVFDRVGPERAPLVYKLLSRACHPDAGGSHELQLELNQAFCELERRTA